MTPLEIGTRSTRIMIRARGLVIVALALFGLVAWKHELIHVAPPGDVPVPLRVLPTLERRNAMFDASLPMVPVGVRRLAPGNGVLIVHYWAPWAHHSGPQATGLDSLRRTLAPGSVEVALVCFDPYPSVSRYVARMRLRLPVLLDLRHALSDSLRCPSIPYTYVLDPSGRIAVAQAGEVDWLAPATRTALEALAREPAAPPSLAPAAIPS
jgi:hypothetical protein